MLNEPNHTIFENNTVWKAYEAGVYASTSGPAELFENTLSGNTLFAASFITLSGSQFIENTHYAERWANDKTFSELFTGGSGNILSNNRVISFSPEETKLF